MNEVNKSLYPQKLLAKTPDMYAIVCGSAEGKTKLNAFDNALLNAGVGDTNLMRMSSILPPAANQVDIKDLSLPPGAFIPLAYAHNHSSKHGQYIASAVAVGIPENDAEAGVIMEFNGTCRQDRAEFTVRQMVENAFKNRQRAFREIKSLATEHLVYSCGATFAGVVLWYE